MTTPASPELRWIEQWLRRYDLALAEAVTEGQTSQATAGIRLTNASRFIRFVETGDLRLKPNLR